jgi:hypothetical protein
MMKKILTRKNQSCKFSEKKSLKTRQVCFPKKRKNRSQRVENIRMSYTYRKSKMLSDKIISRGNRSSTRLRLPMPRPWPMPRLRLKLRLKNKQWRVPKP